MRYLKQNTAVTILIGQLFNWSDSKTLLYDALVGNDNFDPTDLVCTLTKGTTQSTLTLAKSASDNDINLVSGGMATLELTAVNTDTLGELIISFTNATAGGEVLFPCKFEFSVIPANIYDSLFGSDKLQVDIEQVKGGNIAGVNDFKADITGLSTFKRGLGYCYC